MSLLQDVMFTGVERRREANEAARLAGRRGATRLPDSVLFATGEPSDSMIVERLDALEQGRRERAADNYDPRAYWRWLVDHSDRLTDACIASGCADGGTWLRHRYLIETGKQP